MHRFWPTVCRTKPGAQLCLWLDAMGVPDWQQALNKQTLDAPVTLYDILKGFVEENGTPGA